MRHEFVRIRWFDAKAQSVNAPIHELMVNTKDSSYLMEFLELEDLVGDLLYVTSPEMPSTYIKLFPTKLLTFARPDILIGIKDYARFNVNQTDVLPSGFHKYTTELGSVIAGEGRLSHPVVTSAEEMGTCTCPVQMVETIAWKTRQDIPMSDKDLDQMKEEEKARLETNFGPALGRFKSTLRKPRAKPAPLAMCHENKMVVHYLPHHNVLVGFESPMEFEPLYDKIKEIFSHCSMKMREFITSAVRQLLLIPEEDKLPVPKAKLLGLKWNVEKDEISILSPSTGLDDLVTKRKAIALIATPFDPLGIISPAILPDRRFLQKLWEQKFDWDEVLPDQFQIEWKELTSSWRNLVFTFPRHVGWVHSNDHRLEIHLFLGASGSGLGRILEGDEVIKPPPKPPPPTN
jgi:hypothetical protein